MSHTDDPSPTASPPTAEQLLAWLEQSHDLIVLTDADGRIAWANAGFTRVTGIGVEGNLLTLVPTEQTGGAARETLLGALRSGFVPESEIGLRTATGAAIQVNAKVARADARWLWTFQDVTASCELRARVQHQSELLDMAQEFGRLGVWEREIPSGKGRWDRHVFKFWGLDPASGTPNYSEAVLQIHPDDRAKVYSESTREAGHYSYRYRVIQPNGGTRWVHSQWQVKNSPQGTPERAIGILMDDTEVYELARTLDSTAAQLKLAVDLGNIVIWRHDLLTNRLHYNDHGYAVLGLPVRPEGLSLEEVRAFTHPDDLARVLESAQRALQTNGPVDVESRYLRSDGTWRHMLVRRVVERSPSGVPLAFLGVSLDLTDRVEHSHRTAQLAQRLEVAAEAARVGIWTTAIGPEIRTEWNAQMYELFDMVGASRPPTLAEWVAARVHPDDAEQVRRGALAYLRSGRGAFEREFRIRLGDGRTRWVMLRANVDRNSEDVKRVFGIAMDVTERHEAQAALVSASERAALIARHAGIGTWETLGDGGAARWDEQMFRLRGLEPGNTVPDRHERLAMLHPDDRTFVLDAQEKFELDAPPTAYEFRVLMPDGSLRWLASRSAALRDEQGNAVRRVGVNWDITASKNAELARQQAALAERESRAKSQFLSRMSHELRTPLNAVLGFTQLLQIEARAQPDATAQLGKLGHIRAAGEHLLALIDDALDLSTLEAGMLKLDLQPVSLAAAVASALPLVQELAASQRIAVQSGRLDGTAHADPTRLHQVLLNLLTNAIKYNRPGGLVVVESIVEGDVVRFSVQDTGRGMRPDQLAHLFEPFNRLGREVGSVAGSGIGLTVVKALVEGMGGRIDVSSQPDHGTVFEITLPAIAGDHCTTTLPTENRATAPVSPPPERSGQLLYIEDNDVNVLLVEELVKSMPGLRLASEATGSAGVARARSLRPDVILIDMQLPDFDGFEVLRQLRSHAETASIKCIALTANALSDDIDRGLAGGFDAYWTKPIKFKPFLEALDRLFPLRPAA